MPSIVTQDEANAVEPIPRFHLGGMSVDAWEAGCDRFGPARFGAYVLTQKVGLTMRLAAGILGVSPGTVCKRSQKVAKAIESASRN